MEQVGSVGVDLIQRESDHLGVGSIVNVNPQGQSVSLPSDPHQSARSDFLIGLDEFESVLGVVQEEHLEFIVELLATDDSQVAQGVDLQRFLVQGTLVLHLQHHTPIRLPLDIHLVTHVVGCLLHQLQGGHVFF